MRAIGIDLGTVNSCVAVWKRDCVDVIANIEGSRTTPSTVAFTQTERLVGSSAVAQMTKNCTNTVYDVKRLIGRKFNDPEVQEDKTRWPFTVTEVGGKPKIQVMYRNEEKMFSPEEISAMVLQKLKETAEKHLGCDVKDAVISVPAYFTDAQRQATVDAGKIAGLNVLRIINEPTAAALAYAHIMKPEGKRNILVYDLGGGTFDVSVVTVEEGSKFIVKATTGHTRLGGGDFDNLLVNHLAFKFEQNSGIDVLGMESKKPLIKLKIASEAAKHILSSNFLTDIEVDALVENKDFSMSVSRARFEQLCLDTFKSTLTYVDMALENSKISKKDIDDVVLVGGSTRIPKIQELLKEYFLGKNLKLTVNPEEAVAYGAAIQAAVLNGDATIGIRDIKYNDLTSMSLGIELCEGTMNVVIPRNTQIPHSVTRNFVTENDNQTNMEIKVYEGENRIARENHLLGMFYLQGIPAAPAEQESADITYDMDDDGILKVTAVVKSKGITKSLEIRFAREQGLSPEEILRMSADSEQFQEHAEMERQRTTMHHQLRSYAFSVIRSVNDADEKLTEDEEEETLRVCNQTLEWADDNATASTEEVAQKLEALQINCRHVVEKVNR